VSHSLVPTLLAAGDVCLAHVRKAPVTEGILPIKMYEAMSCARPVILAVEGEAHRIAEEANAAISIEPENPKAMADAILHLREHPDLASQLGSRGRAYIETRFDYDRLTKILDVRIQTLLHEQGSNTFSGKSVKSFPLARRLHPLMNRPDVHDGSTAKTALIQSVETDVQSYQPTTEIKEADPDVRRRRV
jgi:Glycosyl transferases group 1